MLRWINTLDGWQFDWRIPDSGERFVMIVKENASAIHRAEWRNSTVFWSLVADGKTSVVIAVAKEQFGFPKDMAFVAS